MSHPQLFCVAVRERARAVALHARRSKLTASQARSREVASAVLLSAANFLHSSPTMAATTGAGKVPRIAVVGGGISGTLASLVLRNRNLSPLLIDVGRGGVGGRLRSNRSKLSHYGRQPAQQQDGHRSATAGGGGCSVDAGAQFFRASDPRLATVFGMLERAGMLAEWKGRFGLLGSRGGGFLPSSIVGNAGLRGMGRDRRGVVGPDGSVSTHGGGSASDSGSSNAADSGNGSADNKGRSPTDAGDFCGFVENHRPDAVPTYVASPSNTDLCPNICAQAGIDVLSDTRVIRAETVAGGGWKLQVESSDDETDTSPATEEIFDALILTTHDPSLAASTVRCIADGEAAAVSTGGSAEADAAAGTIQDRLNHLANDLQSLRDTGRLPLFTWSGRFDSTFSQSVPFDAASVPGSHFVQFLARESSKPGRLQDTAGGNSNEDGIWTAVSTSAFAADVLKRLGSTREASEEASKVMSGEVSNLLSAATDVDGIGSRSDSADATPSVRSDVLPCRPRDASAVRWASAMTSKTLGLKEDSIALAPWRVAIGGDFIREGDAHETPFEAAALSGLEAGERVASFFARSGE